MTNRIILHLAVAIALMPITSHAADSAKASEWRVGHQMDRMTEEPVWFASSKWIGPEEPTRPPFDNLRSTIGFECAAEGEWIGMAFSEVPRLRRTQAYLFEETRYVELRIRWDQTVTKMRFDYEPGDMYLQFHEADEAVRRLKQSKTVLVELPWEGEESVYLRFSLTGSRNAIERAQDQCERLPGRLATRAKQEKQLDALAEILCEAIAPGCMEWRATDKAKGGEPDTATAMVQETPEAAIASLPADAQHWVHESCPRSLGPSFWTTCVRREVDALRAGMPDISHLTAGDRAWVRASCPRSLGPELVKNCIRGEKHAIESGIPSLSSLSSEQRTWVRESCPKSLGPSVYRGCVNRELDALGASQ